jgi:acyl-coenzyme A synthetase/AMP-(fatty) acid ligase
MIGVPDEIGDERIVLALVPAPDAGPGLAARVQASLPDLIDVYALPDEVVVLPELPLSGRTRKIDRSALRTRLAR